MKRAYVQCALCSPSRTSFLTGRRPDTTRVYDLKHYFRDVGGNFTTIPQFFKSHGYRSVGMGKIFHPGVVASNNEDPPSWNKFYYLEEDPDLSVSWRAVSKAERLKDPLIDELVVAQAKKSLHNLASGRHPFFLAIGFRRPHLPFVFPEEYLADYPTTQIQIPGNDYAPIDMPAIAWSKYEELRSYHDIGALNVTGNLNTTLPDQIVKDLRRAYFSSVTFVDAMVGEVLAEVEKLNLMDDTIISFIGDHGFSLGEHGLWAKNTNFEDAVHAPMMIRVPGLTDHGAITYKLVEFVDLFPTIVEAAGFPQLHQCPERSSQVYLCTEGKSMVPLMTDPDAQWKSAVFSQYERPGNVMGYSVKTDRYRYTEWVRLSERTNYNSDMADGHVVGRELYDHENDYQENVNLADHHDKVSIVASLKQTLHDGWRPIHTDLIGK
ncbi:iduronate 2-sulfatase [Patella vulgata]|uniref:iduronate 2-sulfatase n=1 Tax=Patella vulgata TaxID=6465 RepID=UPI00217FA315|nr:iduronate 2-sulfatase [Patella vulgata]